MGGLFSKKSTAPKQSRVTEQDRAVLQLKQQRDRLRQYQRQLEQRLARDRDVARELIAAGKKDRALLLLRKKKFIESLFDKTDAQLENIDQMVHRLEFTQIEHQVLRGLEAGNEALKVFQRLYSLEDVERIMDDTHEAREYQDEVTSLLSGAGGLTEDDEEACLAELEALVGAQTPADELGPLPDVPTEPLPQATRAAPAKQRSSQRQLVEA